mmetsp:Transcript_35496/g.105989  ORF Transcript_35496/g.105989 Transcript_35496/m.105989 type:complete len:94 (-) Transcript_35496:848-1129(-)
MEMDVNLEVEFYGFVPAPTEINGDKSSLFTPVAGSGKNLGPVRKGNPAGGSRSQSKITSDNCRKNVAYDNLRLAVEPSWKAVEGEMKKSVPPY